jgi:adenine-specific DNA-methyltransferase
MNKEVKTIKKNKSLKNKNDIDSNLNIQNENEFKSLIENNNENNTKSKKINCSKSIKLVENSEIEISNNGGKKEHKSNLLDMKETKKNNLGQFFTTDESLQKKLYEFILNKPKLILEPSIGAGDLINYILSKSPKILFDMYEIDTNIEFLNTINKKNIIFGDFLKKKINKTYDTIIGNPPYVKTSKGNLYIDFIEKCYNLLNENGELIFIIPSDFFKLTSSSKLLNIMIENGTFTHIYHPHNENLFENASIDVIIFRYCKNNKLDKTVLYNDIKMHINNSDGLITFTKNKNTNTKTFKDYFDIYVGIVSGRDEIYKNDEFGNINVITGNNIFEKFILINEYPSENIKINEYLLKHKKELLDRRIKKFNEKNWFEWGAPRNITTIEENLNKDCIYIHNLTRQKNVAFKGKVNYFGGSLLILIPKEKVNLNKIIDYLNSDVFKNNFMFSGRFKLGHRQISNSYIDISNL